MCLAAPPGPSGPSEVAATAPEAWLGHLQVLAGTVGEGLRVQEQLSFTPLWFPLALRFKDLPVVGRCYLTIATMDR